MYFARTLFISLLFVFAGVGISFAATDPVNGPNSSSFITLTPYAVDENGHYTYVLQGSVPTSDYNNNSDWWGYVSYDIKIIGDDGTVLGEINDLNYYGYAHELNMTGPELNIYGIVPLDYMGENVTIQLIENWPDVPYVTENDSVLFEIEQYDLNSAREQMDAANEINAPPPPVPNMPDPAEDSDGDGIPNVSDPDYIGNLPQTDTDGDGVPDNFDTEPTRPNDLDGDGILDGDDTDMDGDGVPNRTDTDTDGDGIPNSSDTNTDSDGDGVPDPSDSSPTGSYSLPAVNVNCATWGSASGGEDITACIASWGAQANRFFIGIGLIASLLLLPFIGYLLASGNPGNIEKGWELLNSWFWGIALLLISGFLVSIIGRDLFGVK